MVTERTGAPQINFERGLFEFSSNEFGPITRGKVRDIVTVKWGGQDLRVMITTDRQSAYDRIICTVPGKGQILNLTHD